MRLPKAKTGNIAVQNLRDETLIYNLSNNKAFCLNDTAAKVFNGCDGQTSHDDLKKWYKFTDDLIYLALDELNKNELLDNYESNHFKGLSRCEVVKKVGLSSLTALPVITGLVAPVAAQAVSRCVVGTCIPAGNDLCGYCGKNSGQINYTRFNSTNGTCSGGVVGGAGSVGCNPGGNLTLIFDARIIFIV